jgi:DNA-binding MarR family transcriptional regulator
MAELPQGFFERFNALRVFLTAGMQRGLGAIAEQDLTLAQAMAVFWLAEHGAMSIGQLQAAIGRSQAATSHLVEQLERRSLVRRRLDPNDRRRRLVELAAKGRTSLRKIEALRRTALADVFEPVPQPTLDRFDAALAEVLDAIQR